jgi:hypothetical protein
VGEVLGHWPKFTSLKIMAWNSIGPSMSRKVLKINVKIMFRVSVRGLTLDEMQIPDEQKRRQEYDEAIKMKLVKGMQYHELKLDPDLADFVTPTRDC